MSEILERVRELALLGEIQVSRHGFRELAADDILIDDAVSGIEAGILIEEYPAFAKGPSILVLQRDGNNRRARGLGHPGAQHVASGPGDCLSSGSATMVARFHEAKKMRRPTVEFVREGKYAAEVPIELIEDEGGWSPYLSLEDARKLEAVRRAVRDGDVIAAAKHARIFELLPVSA